MSKQSIANKQALVLVNRTAGIVAAAAATRVSILAWRAFTGKNPPRSTTDPDIDLKEALAWAVVAGALAELTKVAINRAVVHYWTQSTTNNSTKTHNRDK